MAYISAALYVYMVTGGAMVSWCLCMCVLGLVATVTG